jgi:hypothetical protein
MKTIQRPFVGFLEKQQMAFNDQGVHYYNEYPDPDLVARARYAASRLGWRVQKSRQRYQHVNNRGLLRLLDSQGNVIAGVDFDMSPRDVITYCGLSAGR